jgi:hypothetical protein
LTHLLRKGEVVDKEVNTLVDWEYGSRKGKPNEDEPPHKSGKSIVRTVRIGPFKSAD